MQPYCINMENTKANYPGKTSGIKAISIPRVPGARAMWSSNAIGEIAKAHNIERVYYCDRELFSVLGGLWSKDSIIIYGE